MGNAGGQLAKKKPPLPSPSRPSTQPDLPLFLLPIAAAHLQPQRHLWWRQRGLHLPGTQRVRRRGGQQVQGVSDWGWGWVFFFGGGGAMSATRWTASARCAAVASLLRLCASGGLVAWRGLGGEGHAPVLASGYNPPNFTAAGLPAMHSARHRALPWSATGAVQRSKANRHALCAPCCSAADMCGGGCV